MLLVIVFSSDDTGLLSNTSNLLKTRGWSMLTSWKYNLYFSSDIMAENSSF